MNDNTSFEQQPFRVLRIIPGSSGVDGDPMALIDVVHVDYGLLLRCELIGPDEIYVRPADWEQLVLQYLLHNRPVDFESKLGQAFFGVDAELVMDQMQIAVQSFLGLPAGADVLEEFVTGPAWPTWIAANSVPALSDAFRAFAKKGGLSGSSPEGFRGR